MISSVHCDGATRLETASQEMEDEPTVEELTRLAGTREPMDETINTSRSQRRDDNVESQPKKREAACSSATNDFSGAVIDENVCFTTPSDDN